MPDCYLYDDVPVLKNKLDIKDGNTLDLVEAEQSRASMMILYEQGFHDFHQLVCVRFIGSCLKIFMIRRENIESSILRSGNGF